MIEWFTEHPWLTFWGWIAFCLAIMGFGPLIVVSTRLPKDKDDA